MKNNMMVSFSKQEKFATLKLNQEPRKSIREFAEKLTRESAEKK